MLHTSELLPSQSCPYSEKVRPRTGRPGRRVEGGRCTSLPPTDLPYTHRSAISCAIAPSRTVGTASAAYVLSMLAATERMPAAVSTVSSPCSAATPKARCSAACLYLSLAAVPGRTHIFSAVAQTSSSSWTLNAVVCTRAESVAIAGRTLFSLLPRPRAAWNPGNARPCGSETNFLNRLSVYALTAWTPTSTADVSVSVSAASVGRPKATVGVLLELTDTHAFDRLSERLTALEAPYLRAAGVTGLRSSCSTLSCAEPAAWSAIERSRLTERSTACSSSERRLDSVSVLEASSILYEPAGSGRASCHDPPAAGALTGTLAT